MSELKSRPRLIIRTVVAWNCSLAKALALSQEGQPAHAQGNNGPVSRRFPGTKASYHALLDVADNELVAEAQAREAAAC